MTAEQAYVQALKLDLEREADSVRGREVQTIFIGGGTPSLFSADNIAKILETIAVYLKIAVDAEVTLEANPGSSEYRKFAQFLSAGVNRLSLGVQSFNDQSLSRLGRVHTAADAQAAFVAAREAGFENINIDLMFGLPAQTFQQAKADIQQAVELQPEHISYYQLTIEPNTLFYSRRPRLPNEQTISVTEDAATDQLSKTGYQRYEVSAYAKAGRQSRHNLNYWHYGDYLGIGAGAHSKLTVADGTVIRFSKPRHPDSYIHSSGTGQVRISEHIVSQEELIFEFMLNALRLTVGFKKSLFRERTGLAFELLHTDIEKLKQKQLLEEHAQSIRTTADGLRFLNEVQMTFLPQTAA